MPSFSFRFHECNGTVTRLADDVAAADPAGAHRIALGQARAIMADEVREGRLCLACWIVILDGHGHTVGLLQFGDALALRTERDCDHETRDHAHAYPDGAPLPGVPTLRMVAAAMDEPDGPPRPAA